MREVNRTVRRHHVARLRKKREFYWWRGTKTPRQIGILLHTPAACSCWMCGNPRRRGFVTVQERKLLQNVD